MKKTFLLVSLITCSLVNAQNQVQIDSVILKQVSSKLLEVHFPRNCLNTGNSKIKKRIAVYPGYLLQMKDGRGHIKILNDYVWKLEGFCNITKTFSVEKIEIDDVEYILEVSYILGPNDVRTQTKSLIIQ